MFTSAPAELATESILELLEGTQTLRPPLARLPLAQFTAVSLEELNAKAEMLERLDNKYVVGTDVLCAALQRLAGEFDVLEINGERSFTYDTCYFDGPALPCFFEHHQGRRVRAKVRMRSYREAGLCFVEVKLKDKRGITVKKRLKYDAKQFGVLDSRAHGHVQQSFRALYARDFPHELNRVLDMSYRRTTLVAKQGGERMTIDSDLRFFAQGQSRAVDPGMFVLETKSSNGNGLADRVLRALNLHPTSNCSKYCVGTVFMNDELKHNKFLPAVRHLSRRGATRSSP